MPRALPSFTMPAAGGRWQPFYKVLVHTADRPRQATYVAQENLELLHPPAQPSSAPSAVASLASDTSASWDMPGEHGSAPAAPAGHVDNAPASGDMPGLGSDWGDAEGSDDEVVDWGAGPEVRAAGRLLGRMRKALWQGRGAEWVLGHGSGAARQAATGSTAGAAVVGGGEGQGLGVGGVAAAGDAQADQEVMSAGELIDHPEVGEWMEGVMPGSSRYTPNKYLRFKYPGDLHTTE